MKSLLKLPYTDISLTGGRLVFIGSRPGMGRTQYLLQLISTNIESHKCICYFPFQRNEIINNKFLENNIKKSDNIITNFNFIFNANELSDSIQKDIQKYNPSYIIIDGLERIEQPSFHNTNFNNLVRELYLLTQELKVSIICSAYLSSALEERFGNKYPYLTDFNSSSIEIFSDLVLGLHRPCYYGLEEDEEGNSIKNIAQIITLKNSFGIKKQYDFHYEELTNKFYK